MKAALRPGRRVLLWHALLVLGAIALLAINWWVHARMLGLHRLHAHGNEVLADLAQLERATAPQPALLRCAVSKGDAGPPSSLPPSGGMPGAALDPRPVWQRLRALTAERPEQQRSLDALLPLFEALNQQYLQPLAAACGATAPTSPEQALAISAAGLEQRSRILAVVQDMRQAETSLRGEREAGLRGSDERSDGLFSLLALATLALAVTAGVALRRFMARLADADTRVQHEAAERDNAQQRQRDSQRRLQMVMDHIPDAVIAFDEQGSVQWINPAGEAMFASRHDVVRSHPVWRLVPELEFWIHWPDTQPQDEAMPAGLPWTVRRELMLGLREDGREFPIDISVVQTRAYGERIGVCVCRDLSELERMERMKHEFISMVSHELRTPLTSIRGSLSMLADGGAGELSAPVRRLVTLAHSNTERLVALVNDILDFEKLRAGEMRMQLETLCLDDAARAAIEACEGYAHEHGVGLSLDLHATRLSVEADALRLGQVLANLLSNAVKFSPEGGQVRAAVGGEGGRAWVSVGDDGPGVPPELVDQLFLQPFVQADQLATRARGGTGLGLAISKALMDQMGGQIGFEAPQPGRGATFFVSLPLRPDQAALPS
ncbi:MAG TPA: ATP-binding protein [Methylibium sp.]